MSKFLKLVISVVAILIVCVSLTLTVRLFPAPRILDFNPSGCELPCVLDIVPGVTKEWQSQQLLATYTSASDQIEWDFAHQVKGNSPDLPFVGVYNTYPDRYVVRISVRVQRSKGLTTLGQMVAAGYKINKIFRSDYAMGTLEYCLFLITFDEKGQIIAVVSSYKNIDAASEVTDLYAIDVRDPGDFLGDVLAKWHAYDEVRWLGFTSVQRYRDEPVIVEQ